MKLPVFRRISEADFPATAKTWIGKLLTPLNLFIDQVRNTFNKNITFHENISCQIKELTFSTSESYSGYDFTPLQFLKEFDRKAVGLFVLQVFQIPQPVGVQSFWSIWADWEDMGNGNIQINYVAGLRDSMTYKIRFLLI